MGHSRERAERVGVASRHGPGRGLSGIDRDGPSVGRLAASPIGPRAAASMFTHHGPSVGEFPLTVLGPMVGRAWTEVLELRLEVVGIRVELRDERPGGEELT